MTEFYEEISKNNSYANGVIALNDLSDYRLHCGSS